MQAPNTATPVPELKPVQSSQIFAIGYDVPTLTLAIQFVSRSEDSDVRRPGSIYLYDRVPKSLFDGFASAPSAGTYFGKHIKEQFSYRKVS